MGIKRRTDRNGGWRARYRGPDGREHQQTFQRKEDAEKWLTLEKGKVLKGDWVDPVLGQVTVGELGPRWLKTKARRKATTVATYASLWETHVKPRWENVPVAKVQYLDVAEWIAALPVSAARARQVHYVLSSILNLAVKGKMLGANPALDVELTKVPSREKLFLTHAQVDALATAAGEHWAPLIYFLAYTGCRWGEAVALTVGRLDLLHARANIEVTLVDIDGRLSPDTPKNQQRRTVPLPRFLVELLTTRVAGKEWTDLVFTSATGQPVRNSNFRHRVFDPACVKAGIPVVDHKNGVIGLTPHGLRHTAASLAIASGASVKAVQKMLGHQTATMTLDLYGHLFPDEMDALASALDKAAEAARSKTADVRQLKKEESQ